MWLFEVLTNSQVTQFFLVGGLTYTIGRSNCTIIVGMNDPTISRHHASLIVSGIKAEKLVDMTHIPNVTLLDMSKHGTFVNNVRVPEITKRCTINSGDVIRFGSSVEARLRYHPLIATLSPTLSLIDINRAIKVLSQIGSIINPKVQKSEDHLLPLEHKTIDASLSTHNSYFNQEIDTSFGKVRGIEAFLSPELMRQQSILPAMLLYVTNSIEIAEQTCMISMLYGYSLCDVEYLYRLLEVIIQSPFLSWHHWPRPYALETYSLVDCHYFKPPLFLFDLFHTHVKSISSVFRGYHYAFLEKPLYEKFRFIIATGGGRISFINPIDVLRRFNTVTTSSVCIPIATNEPITIGDQHSKPLLVTKTCSKINDCHLRLLGLLCDDLDAHGLNLRVVISEELFQHIGLLIKGNDVVTEPDALALRDAALCLFKNCFHLVHEDNIHYVIYTNDLPSQMSPTSAGVLFRSELHDQSEMTDSDETVEDDCVPVLPMQRLIPGIDHCTASLYSPKQLSVMPATQQTRVCKR